MRIEIRPAKDNPFAVEFFAGGKKLENIQAERVWNTKDRLVARAVVSYDKRNAELPPASISEETAQDLDGGRKKRGTKP